MSDLSEYIKAVWSAAISEWEWLMSRLGLTTALWAAPIFFIAGGILEFTTLGTYRVAWFAFGAAAILILIVSPFRVWQEQKTQVENLKKELHDHSASDDVLKRISDFMEMGSAIQTAFIADNDSKRISSDHGTWTKAASDFLIENTGHDYASRFRNAQSSLQVPSGRSAEGGSYWAKIEGKKLALSHILSDLRRQA